MIIQLLTFVFDLILPLAAGYMLVRAGRFNNRSFDPFINITIVGIVPFLLLLSFWHVDLNINLLILPLIGLLMQAVPGVTAWVIAGFKKQDSLEKGSYILSSMLCNRGVLGGLALFILFGEEAYAYTQLVGLLGLPMLIAVGFPIAHHYRRSQSDSGCKSRQFEWKMLLDKKQTALLGLAAGALLNLSGWERPEAFGTVFSALIHIVAWMLLIPVGASINFGQIKGYWHKVLDIIPVRFLFCPLVFYFLGAWIGLEGTQLHTVTILSATPTAINAVVTAKLYNLNVHLAAGAFILTTAIFMGIIFPILLLITAYLGLS